MPPSGALKAAATPVAAPTPIHVRCCFGSRSSTRPLRGPRSKREKREATIEPMCTIGPSRPRGSAVATTIVMPNTLHTSVDRRSSPGMRQPLRNAFTPGGQKV